ncbi:thioesterase II family protein [Streptomyces chartreusis]|uniref:thioesterase II family protein n=1 Tax=Streptomyces chartreusis TaxID=1969 RepID=UPI003827C316
MSIPKHFTTKLRRISTQPSLSRVWFRKHHAGHAQTGELLLSPLVELPSRSIPNVYQRPHYVCFPPAGGSIALLHHLASASPRAHVWGYQYPGRSHRVREPAAESIQELAASATDDLVELFDARQLRNTVLVGFSFGGLVALEVAQRMSSLGASPAALVMVGVIAPQRWESRRHITPQETDLLEEAALPQSDSSSELRAYTQQLLRADMLLAARYTGPTANKAPCPIAALCGEEDWRRVDDDATEAWRIWSSGAFATWVTSGSHLGLLSQSRATEFWSWMKRIADHGIGPTTHQKDCV